MNIELWCLGKSSTKLLDAAIDEYCKRIRHYIGFQVVTLDNSKFSKSLPYKSMLEKEAELILQKLQPKDMLIALDEQGKSLTSTQFAGKLNTWMNQSPARLIFLIGGSYGIADSLKAKAAMQLQLSALTFPHQMVRLIFVEQLYRGFSILNNEKYHHE
jgi:23S rRNA (pseudouridine1915-N3)-methyltransferase